MYEEESSEDKIYALQTRRGIMLPFNHYAEKDLSSDHRKVQCYCRLKTRQIKN